MLSGQYHSIDPCETSLALDEDGPGRPVVATWNAAATVRAGRQDRHSQLCFVMPIVTR